jgi:hypothetical protein
MNAKVKHSSLSQKKKNLHPGENFIALDSFGAVNFCLTTFSLTAIPLFSLGNFKVNFAYEFTKNILRIMKESWRKRI